MCKILLTNFQFKNILISIFRTVHSGTNYFMLQIYSKRLLHQISYDILRCELHLITCFDH